MLLTLIPSISNLQSMDKINTLTFFRSIEQPHFHYYFMLMPYSKSMLCHVGCSFFSWFSETPEKDDLDDIHDEVSSILVYKNSSKRFFSNAGRYWRCLLLLLSLLLLLLSLHCCTKLSLPKNFRLQRSSRRICGRIHSPTSIM